MNAPQPAEVVVITGASASVCRATVRAFARRGARIGLIARGRDGLEGAREDVEAAGGRALVVPADMADAKQVEAAAAAVETAFGPIDIWINNAMVSVFSPVKEMTPDEFRRVTDVTYLGTSMAPSPHSGGCCRVIVASSSRWVRLWPIVGFRYKRPTAGPSTPSRASLSRFAVS